MTTTLVTGGTGLVGSRLLRRFVEQGIECRGLVRPGRSLPDGVEPVEADILQPDTLPAALAGVDTVVHLAASFRSGDDEETRAVTLTGAQNLIAATTAHAPHARFLLASTSNVYNDSGLDHAAREDDPVHPTQAYPASKVIAEQALRDSGLTWAILRLPFVYGDGDGHLDALPRMMATWNVHPAQRMSTAHHADVAAAFALARTGAFDGRTVNIADDAALSVLELSRIAGQDYPTSTEPLAAPWQWQTDVALARSLGLAPSVPTVHSAARDGRL